MPKQPTYLCKNRHGGYQFRVIIPQRVRHHFPANKREFRRSVTTDSYRVAVKRARLWAVHFDFLIEAIERMGKNKDDDLTEEEISAIISTLDPSEIYGENWGAFGHVEPPPLSEEEKAKQTAEREHHDREFQLDKARREAATLLAQKRRDTVRAEARRKAEEEFGLDAGDLDGNSASSATPPSDKPAATEQSTLQEFIDSYIAEKASKGHIRGRKDRTVAEYTRELNEACEIIGGERLLGGLEVEDLEKCYRVMLDLPASRNSKPEFKDKPISEILENQTYKKRSVGTVNSVFGRLSTALAHAVKRRLIPSNPADGVLREKEKVNAKNRREMFTVEELADIFSHPHFTDSEWSDAPGIHAVEPYRFWVLLLCLFTGARLAEVCLLLRNDVVEHDGILTISVTDDEHSDQPTLSPTLESAGRSIKTASSKRLIPLNDTLLEIGFDQYLLDRDKTFPKNLHLFPEMTNKADGPDAASKWFARFLKTVGVHKSRRKVLHSLRHTLATHLKNQGVLSEHVGAVTGHLDHGNSIAPELDRTYDKGRSIAFIKSNVIDKIDYDIDFSHVRWNKPSKWC